MEHVVIICKNTNINGQKLYEILLNKYHLQMEMASRDYVIAMTSICDTDEGFNMFNEMNAHIKEDTIKYLFNITIEEPVERKQTVKITSTSGSSDGTLKKEPKKADKKPGRNDPCPCGSGKKYKKCCGINE